MKKVIIPLILIVGIFLVIFAMGIITNSNEIIVSMNSDKYVILQKSDGFEINMRSFKNSSIPGLPVLPTKIYRFLLPPNATISGISPIINRNNEMTIKLNGKIKKGKSAFIPNEITGYAFLNKNTSARFPAQSYMVLRKKQSGSYNYLEIRFTPCQWVESTNTLIIRKKLDLSIKCIQKTSTKLKLYLPPESFNPTFDNYSEMKSYYQNNMLDIIQNTVIPKYDYLIITSNKILQAAGSDIAAFKDFKISQGFSATVQTANDILNILYQQYNYMPKNSSDSIKQFLKIKQKEWGLKYVLFIGGNNDVPMFKIHTKPLGKDFDVYTDWYYADLDGIWDNTNYANPKYGDFDAELCIGRIPCGQPYAEQPTDENDAIKDEISKILSRITKYEQNTTYSAFSDFPRCNSLLIGAIMDYNKQNNPSHDGAELMEYIEKNILLPKFGSSIKIHKIYEKGDVKFKSPPSKYYNPSDQNISALKDTYDTGYIMVDDAYGLVFWNAHGTSKNAIRRLSIAFPENPNKFAFMDSSFIDTEIPEWPTMAYYSEKYQPIIFSNSCYNGDPNSFNLSRDFLKNLCVATIGNTSVDVFISGWNEFSDGGSDTMAATFAQYFIKDSFDVGHALQKAKEDYYNLFMNSEDINYLIQNILTCTLYGDPSLRLSKKIFLFRPLQYIPFGTDYLDENILYGMKAISPQSILTEIQRYKPIPFPYPPPKETRFFSYDIDNDGYEEIITFMNPSKSGEAAIYDSIEEGSEYIGTTRFSRDEIAQLIQ